LTPDISLWTPLQMRLPYWSVPLSLLHPEGARNFWEEYAEKGESGAGVAHLTFPFFGFLNGTLLVYHSSSIHSSNVHFIRI
jgi:hypothetical protein